MPFEEVKNGFTVWLPTGPLEMRGPLTDHSLKVLGQLPECIEYVKESKSNSEKGVFEEVSKARSAMMGAHNPAEAAKADNMLTGALKSLFAVAEAYPKLEASENFKQLQDEISDTETKVAASRQFYNTTVLDYNNSLETVPTAWIGSMFGFSKEEFFKATEAEKKDVEVKF
jgi:LemA protein